MSDIDDEIDKRRFLEISIQALIHESKPERFLAMCIDMFIQAHADNHPILGPRENLIVMYKSDFAKLYHNQKEKT